ncbi:hypothetical protein [Ferrimicrobium acidiphilum]|uniref:hypothetical protein n=1 Tax=Ferrimicrobium acidiphilum TaxID=121039 RepID=UPI0023EF9A1F|nr:hypothetical protein [Ferrimicrobium acidiphilum]
MGVARNQLHLRSIHLVAAGLIAFAVTTASYGAQGYHAKIAAQPPLCRTGQITATLSQTLAPIGANAFVVSIQVRGSACRTEGYAAIEVKNGGEWKPVRLTHERNPVGTVGALPVVRINPSRRRPVYMVISQSVDPECTTFVPARLELPGSTEWVPVVKLKLWGCSPIGGEISPIVKRNPVPRVS